MRLDQETEVMILTDVRGQEHLRRLAAHLPVEAREKSCDIIKTILVNCYEINIFGFHEILLAWLTTCDNQQ